MSLPRCWTAGGKATGNLALENDTEATGVGAADAGADAEGGVSGMALALAAPAPEAVTAGLALAAALAGAPDVTAALATGGTLGAAPPPQADNRSTAPEQNMTRRLNISHPSLGFCFGLLSVFVAC